MLKKILINLIVIIVILAGFEYYAYRDTEKDNLIFQQQVGKINNINYKTKYIIMESFNPETYRKSYIYKNSRQRPIILFGCSFAEGAELEDNQTPCFKISQLTGRSCINRAKGATGTQFMYYQLKNNDILKEIPEADYIIYIFIWDHLKRLYNYQVNPLIDMFNLRYKNKNGKLEEIKPIFKPLYSSFFIKRLLNNKVYNDAIKEGFTFSLFNKIMKESTEIIKTKYPNSKFIMIEFPDIEKKNLPESEIKELESLGITVVKAKDLIENDYIYNDKYWTEFKIHPSETAWNAILPKFTEKYIK